MPFPIAYIAGSFPSLSETFVYREVRELRRRGWEVLTISLNDPRRTGAARCRPIHAHFAHAPATIAMYAAKQLGIGFSFTGHANDLFQRRALLKNKLKRATFVACISQWHSEFYQSLGADPAKCHVIR